MEPMRLLLAEDEAELSRALCAILAHAGYEVDAAADGEEALYKLDCQSYDLAILDIMMPKVDGLTVLRTLRQKGRDLPVMMLTARAEIDDRVTGLDAGANDYLVKPFAAKELLARIRAITHTSPGAVRKRPAFGDLRLDEGDSLLLCGVASESLTANELKVAAILFAHGSGLTTLEQLRREVWGVLSDTESSAIYVTVSNLRKKVRSLGSTVDIVTARGLGYRLSAPEGDDHAQ